MKLKFTFDRENWHELEITELSITTANELIWNLLHVLGAKELRLVKDE